MKIIIVGAGEVGSNLSTVLAAAVTALVILVAMSALFILAL